MLRSFTLFALPCLMRFGGLSQKLTKASHAADTRFLPIPLVKDWIIRTRRARFYWRDKPTIFGFAVFQLQSVRDLDAWVEKYIDHRPLSQEEIDWAKKVAQRFGLDGAIGAGDVHIRENSKS